MIPSLFKFGDVSRGSKIVLFTKFENSIFIDSEWYHREFKTSLKMETPKLLSEAKYYTEISWL